jgi:hypothetical protein
MLQLNKDGQKFLDTFSNKEELPATRDMLIRYRNISTGYNRLLRVFLYVNQDALPFLPRENIDDINSVISRLYESLFWARRSLTHREDDGYTAIDWLLISDREDGMVTESYKLVTQRLIKNCPCNLFLENALIRLMNSYNIAADVSKISVAIASARGNRRVGDLKKKRVGQSFVLQTNEVGDRLPGISASKAMSAKVIDGNRVV